VQRTDWNRKHTVLPLQNEQTVPVLEEEHHNDVPVEEHRMALLPPWHNVLERGTVMVAEGTMDGDNSVQRDNERTPDMMDLPVVDIPNNMDLMVAVQTVRVEIGNESAVDLDHGAHAVMDNRIQSVL